MVDTLEVKIRIGRLPIPEKWQVTGARYVASNSDAPEALKQGPKAIICEVYGGIAVMLGVPFTSAIYTLSKDKPAYMDRKGYISLFVKQLAGEVAGLAKGAPIRVTTSVDDTLNGSEGVAEVAVSQVAKGLEAEYRPRITTNGKAA